jgi:hypothetical protein
MAMFTGMRFYGVPFHRDHQYFKYTNFFEAARVEPEFQYIAEYDLKEEYHRGQQEMVDNFRAEYRRLTPEDLSWLQTVDPDPLREAMKREFYRLYLHDINAVPVELALTIKNAAANDKPFWHRFIQATTA